MGILKLNDIRIRMLPMKSAGIQEYIYWQQLRLFGFKFRMNFLNCAFIFCAVLTLCQNMTNSNQWESELKAVSVCATECIRLRMPCGWWKCEPVCPDTRYDISDTIYVYNARMLEIRVRVYLFCVWRALYSPLDQQCINKRNQICEIN